MFRSGPAKDRTEAKLPSFGRVTCFHSEGRKASPRQCLPSLTMDGLHCFPMFYLHLSQHYFCMQTLASALMWQLAAGKNTLLEDSRNTQRKENPQPEMLSRRNHSQVWAIGQLRPCFLKSFLNPFLGNYRGRLKTCRTCIIMHLSR